MSYLSHDEVCTRKPHRCWGCLVQFPRGTAMHRVVSKDDGFLMTTYWCKPCQDFIDEAVKRDPYLRDDGFELGYVAECRREAEQEARRGGV